MFQALLTAALPLLSWGAPAAPLEGCTPQLPPARVPFHLGLAQSPYPDWNLDKGAVHPPFSS